MLNVRFASGGSVRAVALAMVATIAIGASSPVSSHGASPAGDRAEIARSMHALSKRLDRRRDAVVDRRLLNHELRGSVLDLVGRVIYPDGSPAAGATVVTRQGQTVLAGVDGSFKASLFEMPVDGSIAVRAFARSGSDRYRAGLEVATGVVPTPSGNRLDLPPIVLEAAASCTGVYDWRQGIGDPGMGDSGYRSIFGMAVFDDGNGPAVYAGGQFASAGGVAASNIARWDGEQWSPLGSGVNGPVSCLAVFDDGSGPALYVGGNFTMAGGGPANRVARWDGSSWSAVGVGMDQGSVWTLAVLDDGLSSALFAGGTFTTIGGATVNHIARWNGVAWSSVGGGVDGFVSELVIHNDGSGLSLFAGGRFLNAAGVPANRIARWNGSSWAALGSGMNDWVETFAIWDDGFGAALYAGGLFTTAGGMTANRVARWDGSSWSAVGSGVNDAVYALTTLVTSEGSMLVAGGRFTAAGSSPAARVAMFDGATWWSLGDGVNTGEVWSLANWVPPGSSVEELALGGTFTAAGGGTADRVAAWGCLPWCEIVELAIDGVVQEDLWTSFVTLPWTGGSIHVELVWSREDCEWVFTPGYSLDARPFECSATPCSGIGSGDFTLTTDEGGPCLTGYEGLLWVDDPLDPSGSNVNPQPWGLGAVVLPIPCQGSGGEPLPEGELIPAFGWTPEKLTAIDWASYMCQADEREVFGESSESWISLSIFDFPGDCCSPYSSPPFCGLSTVWFSADPNPSFEPRSATITYSGDYNHSFTLTQAGSPDCNGNGIPDTLEFLEGSQTDCNGNGILDLCEPALVRHVPGDHSTIQAAIDAAPSCGVVVVGPGYYPEPLNLGSKRVSVVSSHGPEVTIIDATGHSGPAVRIGTESSLWNEARLDGFTIRGGSSGATIPDVPELSGGGGVLILNGVSGGMYHSYPNTLHDCVIEDNAAASGAGLFVYKGLPRLADVVLAGNQATSDGGGAMAYESNVEFERCLFEANTAGNKGGGLYAVRGSPRVIASEFIENIAYGSGGGLAWFARTQPCTVESALFQANAAAVSGNAAWVSANATNLVLANTVVCGSGTAPFGGQYTPTGTVVVETVCEDCNGNSVTDAWEILTGQAVDADGDGKIDACQCPGDLDGDGIVNGQDLGILLIEWGPGPHAADLDGNGVVDGGDLGILLIWWGECSAD